MLHAVTVGVDHAKCKVSPRLLYVHLVQGNMKHHCRTIEDVHSWQTADSLNMSPNHLVGHVVINGDNNSMGKRGTLPRLVDVAQ